MQAPSNGRPQYSDNALIFRFLWFFICFEIMSRLSVWISGKKKYIDKFNCLTYVTLIIIIKPKSQFFLTLENILIFLFVKLLFLRKNLKIIKIFSEFLYILLFFIEKIMLLNHIKVGFYISDYYPSDVF